MQIGIIGAGGIGQAYARQFLRADCTVVLSNSRGPDSLVDVVRELGSGVRAGTVREAAAQEIVFVAVPWSQVRPVLAGLPQ